MAITRGARDRHLPPPQDCRRHLIGIVAGSTSPDPTATVDRLLDEWETLADVIAQPHGRLMTITNGDHAAVGALTSFGEAMRHALSVQVMQRPLLGDNRILFAYLQADLAHRTAEQLRVLYLTGHNRLIRDEVASLGTIDELRPYHREIIHRGLDLGAANLVLAHNHPSGDRRPSEADVRFTKRLWQLAAPLNLWVLDHIVVGREGCTSLRSSGLL